MTGFVLNRNEFFLNMTGFVLIMTGFVLNMTGLVLNMTGLKKFNCYIKPFIYLFTKLTEKLNFAYFLI